MQMSPSIGKLQMDCNNSVPELSFMPIKPYLMNKTTIGETSVNDVLIVHRVVHDGLVMM